jgi:hypothetical protein
MIHTLFVATIIMFAYLCPITARGDCSSAISTPGTLVSTSCAAAVGSAFGFSLLGRRYDSNNFLVGKGEISFSSNGSVIGEIGKYSETSFNGTVIVSHSGNISIGDNHVSLDGHGFTITCSCRMECPVTHHIPSNVCPGGYVIGTPTGFLCVKFGGGAGEQLPNADHATPNSMVEISGSLLSVSIRHDPSITFTQGFIATADNGKQLRALLLIQNSSQGVLFSACGPFIFENGLNSNSQRRHPQTEGVGVFQSIDVSSTAGPVSNNVVNFGTILAENCMIWMIVINTFAISSV